MIYLNFDLKPIISFKGVYSFVIRSFPASFCQLIQLNTGLSIKLLIHSTNAFSGFINSSEFIN